MSAEQHEPRSVEVSTGEHSYHIHIGDGLLAEAGELIHAVLGSPRIAIVSDENVSGLWMEPLLESLGAARGGGNGSDSGGRISQRIIAPGEASKSFAGLKDLCDWLLETGIERGDCVIALGGGVVGDLAGFAAAILRRGVDIVQIPTSLLAQVDSSIGGKTGINVGQGKNLVGAFHQPRLVITDIATLATLPERELQAGYAEIVKYGLIDRPGFFAWLEEAGASVIQGDQAARLKAVSECAAIKAGVVSRDERETGERALLNLGHTFGHALEGVCGYSGILNHGEAVAVGIVLAFEFSTRRGECPPEHTDRVRTLLAKAGLPVSISAVAERLGRAVSGDEIMRFMEQDKKISDGNLVFILARGIGDAYICKDISRDDVLEFLKTVID